ncbi:MAG: malto-oligosyltrehalose synthase [Paracoccaceae bacterium]
MSAPAVRATYRLQFRDGMDFERATGLVPYLAGLGVSHLYASPLFEAAPGSTHGYDVCDHERMDDDLGGIEGFRALSDRLKAHGLGLLLDIVPNHMAVSTHNPWWRDLLRHGQASRYADHFDVDWSEPKLVVPVLAEPYGAMLEADAFALGRDAEGLVWHAASTAYPVSPASLGVLAEAGRAAGVEGLPADPDALARAIADDGSALDAALARLSKEREAMHRLHEAQPWRLAHWRLSRDGLAHRRFFEIADLVGVRVEDPRVFDDVHRFLFALVEEGRIDGVRIDHIDGLADPQGYLDRLARELPRAVPVWVEKILAPGEALPERWPVAGTTGYEFARIAASALTDPAGLVALSAEYDRFTEAEGEAGHDPMAMLAEAKREVLTVNLAAELARVVSLLEAAAAEDPIARDRGPDTLRRALVDLAVAMPVYRTYLAGDPKDAASRRLLAEVAEAAKATTDLEDTGAIDDVVRLILETPGAAGFALRARIEQTTGALMAKSLEDTTFYRYHRLVSANEVGSEPDHATLAPEAALAALAERDTRQPLGLNATATHDTKRGEDARLRIAAIAADPAGWAGAVAAWEDRLVGEGADDVPDAETRWLFYQALLGAWGSDEPGALTERLSAFMLKAAREDGRLTSWTAPDEDHERRLRDFTARALGDGGFRAAFHERAAPIVARGKRLGLAQLALKLTAPGVPDIYQGTEWADLSFVDPDNRRAVDFEARAAGRGEGYDGDKARLTADLLALRRARPALFEAPLEALVLERPAPRAIGFCRLAGDAALVAILDPAGEAPRFRLPSGLGARLAETPVEGAGLAVGNGWLGRAEDARLPLAIGVLDGAA